MQLIPPARVLVRRASSWAMPVLTTFAQCSQPGRSASTALGSFVYGLQLHRGRVALRSRLDERVTGAAVHGCIGCSCE